jgi:hypothetical protein
MSKSIAATLVGLCMALSACDSTPTEDTAAPTPKIASSEVRLFGGSTPHVVYRNGQVSAAQGALAGLRRLGAAPSALVAGTTQCDLGEITPELDENGNPIPDEFDFPAPLPSETYEAIEVPPDGTCLLDGVTVLQSVTAFDGARLFINSSEVGGNVIGLSATVIQVGTETHIAGNLDMQDASDDLSLPFASCAVTNSTIDGDLSCINSNPGSVVIRPTIVNVGEDGAPPTTIALPANIGGSVNLLGNHILPGHVMLLQGTVIGGKGEVNDNTDAGYKEVTGNSTGQKLSCKRNAATFVGGPNAAGKAKGQCF